MGNTKRVRYDYKPDGDGGRAHRLPWFVAGVGIPLICVGFVTPGKPVQVEDPARTAATAAVELAEIQVNARRRPTSDAAANSPRTGLVANLPAASTAPAAGITLNLTVRRGDSLDRLFRRNNLSLSDLAGLTRQEPAKKHLRLIRPGDELTIRHADGAILALKKEISVAESIVIEKTTDGFATRFVDNELDIREVVKTGTIESSLFLAANKAGVSDRTIMNLAGIFAWDIDFVLDIRKGDQFTVIYEEMYRDGKLASTGEILAAEFVNQGRLYRALRYEDPTGRVDYFTPDGLSVRKAFLRAPLSFSRVSSNFNPRRRHPKLNTIRAHKGVDYAAPTGTPVKAAGDGKIVLRGRKGGYGNTVIIQHGGNISTLYAHLSRFSRARIGSRVRQGDVIGYVGATGLATGPHLHYEYRRNGVHLNPRTVKLPDAEPLNPDYRQAFRSETASTLDRLDAQRQMLAANTPAPSI